MGSNYCIQIRINGEKGVMQVSEIFDDLDKARAHRDRILAEGYIEDNDDDGPIVETSWPASQIQSISIVKK